MTILKIPPKTINPQNQDDSATAPQDEILSRDIRLLSPENNPGPLVQDSSASTALTTVPIWDKEDDNGESHEAVALLPSFSTQSKTLPGFVVPSLSSAPSLEELGLTTETEIDDPLDVDEKGRPLNRSTAFRRTFAAMAVNNLDEWKVAVKAVFDANAQAHRLAAETSMYHRQFLEDAYKLGKITKEERTTESKNLEKQEKDQISIIRAVRSRALMARKWKDHKKVAFVEYGMQGGNISNSTWKYVYQLFGKVERNYDLFVAWLRYAQYNRISQ
ncbi:hypothetical protein KEM55_006230, partial [Ascosphaera atra]